MMPTDFEYAIKKDVRNNPIVRELDEARQRQLWRSAAIGALLVIVLLFSAWQNFELVRHGVEMERLQQQRDAEEEINRHLRLELETLRAPKRIERIAVEQLRLTQPGPDQSIVIERVPESAPAPKSIVAVR